MKKAETNGNALSDHNQYTEAYVGMLNTHNASMQKSSDKKNELKDRFVNVISFIMILSISSFGASIVASFILFMIMVSCGYKSPAVIAGAVTSVISTFSTIIVSIKTLPDIIARYLFNKDEDQFVIELIKNIEKHEANVAKLKNDAKKDAEGDIKKDTKGITPSHNNIEECDEALMESVSKISNTEPESITEQNIE